MVAMATRANVGSDGVPRAVRAIQVVLSLGALVGLLGTVTTLPMLIRMNRWAAFSGYPTHPATLDGGPQTHFTMLGSVSVGTPWVGIVLALTLPVLAVALAVLSTRRSKWVAYAVGAVGAASLSLIGLLLIVLVTFPSARRYYWRSQGPE